jgi:MqsR (Motility quorum-sensing regulator) toxin of toxin-antitoxin system
MQPSYPLEQIKRLFQEDNYLITVTALETAALISFLNDDIVDCVTNHLGESHFYKTMAAERIPGLMQDVYKIRYEGQRVYLKLQINKAGCAVVVSFKEDESSA